MEVSTQKLEIQR